MGRQEGIMQLIYNQINEMIGAGSQLFCMQFPAQPLNYRQYQYDTSDRNSIISKPYSIQEAEFRLSDQLFDISPITAGSNGEKLSVVYSTLINNFIPDLKHLAPFFKDRAGLGSFLLEDSGEKDNEGKSMSRIELSKKLYQEYLEAKNKWHEEKVKKYEDFKEKNDLDGYAKWQSSEGMVRQEQLNNLYNDVVVRGHLHEVLTILGYLNASSIAEELELGKQKMRNSARLSLDGSMTIYPVQFQPNNWFKALTPNLNPQDLTMSQESIRDRYVAKQRELSRAKAELQQMELLSANPGEITRMQTEIDNRKQELNEAELKLVKQYGEGVVGFAKIYAQATAIVPIPQDADVINITKAQALGIVDVSEKYIDSLKKAVKGIFGTYKLQQELNDAISNLTELNARKAQLESRDWKFNKASLEQRIEGLQTEVNDIAGLLANVYLLNSKDLLTIDKQENGNENDTVYELKISETVAGGTFKLKIQAQPTTSQAQQTDDITFEPTNLEGTIQTALETKFTDHQGKLKVTNKGKNIWTITLKDTLKDNDISVAQNNLTPKEPSILSAPQTEAEAELNGMFTEILINIAKSGSTTATSLETTANNSQWGVSTWFSSTRGQSSSSSATADQKSDFFNQEIEIGFRVAKVSFDRGGWFNPQIFKMSHAFSRLADMKVSPGLSIDDIKNKSQTALKDLTEYDGQGSKKLKYIMPAFPVAMAIAKDITIKVKIAEGESKNTKSVVEDASSSSGGFLCFSVSSASSSKSSSESAYHGEKSGHYYIRIPGPQVIGYFLQLVPQDNSVPYEPIFKEGGDSSIIKALDLYNQAKEIMKSEPGKLPKSKESVEETQ